MDYYIIRNKAGIFSVIRILSNKSEVNMLVYSKLNYK